MQGKLDNASCSVQPHESKPVRTLARLDNVVPVFNEGGNIIAVVETLSSAVKSGFEASTAQAVLVFPADGTFNAGIIDQMVAQ